ncbi:MAG: hypothetical protein K2M79_06295 [Muribaculaceae bacterium]|nr:hypothetical protein [Muribaculaceae bacterium]
MSTLKEKLEKFKPEFKSEHDNECFKELAEAFLYGGYISVSDNKEEHYKIFIRTVEFYCHHEGDEKDLPKDPIVYHRNGRYVEGEVPYFPLMSLHAHASGYDITFENKDLKLRSSALIRAYEVYDVIQATYLHYDRNRKLFVPCNDAKDRVNKQSTYLYDFINGFGGNNIKWKDTPIPKRHKELKPAKRQNVYKYDLHENKIVDANGKYIKDDRKWSFTRLDEIENIPD